MPNADFFLKKGRGRIQKLAGIIGEQSLTGPPIGLLVVCGSLCILGHAREGLRLIGSRANWSND